MKKFGASGPGDPLKNPEPVRERGRRCRTARNIGGWEGVEKEFMKWEEGSGMYVSEGGVGVLHW